MVKKIVEKTIKDLGWFKDEINFCLDKWEDAWFTRDKDGNSKWNSLIDTRISALKRMGRSDSEIEMFKAEVAKAIKRKYGRKYKLPFVDTVYKSQNKIESYGRKNESKYSSEYAVEVYDNNGKFIEQVDIFRTFDEATKFVKSLMREDPQYISDNCHYVISEISYDENGEEIGIEDRYVW